MSQSESSIESSLRQQPSGRLVYHGCQLLTLWVFSVGQPLLSLLEDNTPFLSAHQLEALDLVAVTLLLLFGVPFLLLGIEALIPNPWCRYLHRFWMGLLLLLLLMPILKPLSEGLPMPGGMILALAIGLASACVFFLAKNKQASDFLAFLAPAGVVVAVLFLCVSPASALVFPASWQKMHQDAKRDLAEKSPKTPVVLIILDELPVTSLLDETGTIDATRYPQFARLAKTATWYRDTTTVSDKTHHAVPAILTGRYVRDRHPPSVSHYPENLFTWLGGYYRLNVVESLTQLCPQALCKEPAELGSWQTRYGSFLSDIFIILQHRYLPVDWTGYLPGVGESWENFGDGPQTGPELDREQALDRFIAGIGDKDGQSALAPGLHALHVELPHTPWMYLPGGQYYNTHELDATDGFTLPVRKKIWVNQWAGLHGFHRHLLQLGYLDRRLGDILDALEKAEIFDASMIIVTADHGVNFQAGTHSARFVQSLEEPSVADIVSVPLLIKYPHQKTGRVDRQPAQTLDILPTVADVLHLDLPWQGEGVSLLTARKKNRSRRFFNKEEDGFEITPELLAGFQQQLALKHTYFGKRAGETENWIGFLGLLNVHPADVNHLPVLSEPWPGVRVYPIHSEDWETVDPQGRFLPVRLKAHVVVEGDKPDHVLVRINGKPVGVTPLVPQTQGAAWLYLMMPPQALNPGKNTLSFYGLKKQDGQPVLQPLHAQEDIKYTWDPGKNQILTSAGQVIPIQARAGIAGEAVRKPVTESKYAAYLIHSGWAVDTEGQETPKMVLVFSIRGDWLYTAFFNEASPEVAKRYGTAFEESGFKTYIPRHMLKGLDPAHDLRIFVVNSRNIASPLVIKQKENRFH